ncbi:MAG: lyase family protein, partial [Polyangiales bacterium]
MIPRYSSASMRTLWSDAHKYHTWLRVELAACAAMEEAGLVPAGTAQRLEGVRTRLDPERIAAIEKESRHDVIAFLTHVEELGGAPARWLHRGMTSSDVLDTATALLLVQATSTLRQGLTALLT